jgi:hypothetical protein
MAGYFPFNWSNLCTHLQNVESVRVKPGAGITIGQLNGQPGSYQLAVLCGELIRAPLPVLNQ